MNDFLNAQEMHRTYPETFDAPSNDELASLKTGLYAKICENGERFWVEITEIEKDELKGRVDNELFLEHDFEYNDIISFSRMNVMDILDPEDLK